MSSAQPPPHASKRMPFILPQPLHASQTLLQSLGLKRAADVRMLALLLIDPGVIRSTRELASEMGVSRCSVRAYAHYLRTWLSDQALPAGLECCCGQGYRLTREAAVALLDRLPCLAMVTSVAREESRLNTMSHAPRCTTDSTAIAVADPFPVSVHREPEINF